MPRTSLRLAVMTPVETRFWDVAWVNLPGEKGRRGLLPQTAPEILLLQKGLVMFQCVGSSEGHESMVEGGVAHVYTHVDGQTCCDILTEEVKSV